jgi:hypothetical protein
MEMVRRKVQFRLLPRKTSVFTDTGENMNLKPNAIRERQKKCAMAPGWIKVLRPWFVLKYRCQLAARGCMSQRPFDYALYTLESPKARTLKHVAKPTSFWPARNT